MGKRYNISDVKGAKLTIKDLQVFGDGDLFKLLCKVSSYDGKWMKSTKAMEIPGVGCVVQVTTQQGDNVTESCCFVPGVKIVPDENNGRKLEGFTEIVELKKE